MMIKKITIFLFCCLTISVALNVFLFFEYRMLQQNPVQKYDDMLEILEKDSGDLMKISNEYEEAKDESFTHLLNDLVVSSKKEELSCEDLKTENSYFKIHLLKSEELLKIYKEKMLRLVDQIKKYKKIVK